MHKKGLKLAPVVELAKLNLTYITKVFCILFSLMIVIHLVKISFILLVGYNHAHTVLIVVIKPSCLLATPLVSNMIQNCINA